MNMKSVLVIMTALFATLLPSAVHAARYDLAWRGTVHTIQNDLPGSIIRTGDSIAARFSFDDATAGDPFRSEIGGGTYTSYNAVITNFSMSIGSYSFSADQRKVILNYSDNSWGQDAITFLIDSLPGGPFESTLTHIQFQARGPVGAIDGSGLQNGLPYERFRPSLFAGFASETSATRVFGDLSVENQVPELSTWISMLVGFGLLGASLRSDKTTLIAFRAPKGSRFGRSRGAINIA